MCVMARDDPHFRLRIPAELKTRIEQRAARNKRSINAEIVALLEEAMTDWHFTLDEPPEVGTVQHFIWQLLMDQKIKTDELRAEIAALEMRVSKKP